jgi:hypothetical protein
MYDCAMNGGWRQETVDNNSPERIRPCEIQKLIKSLKLRQACGIDGIPNECLTHLSIGPIVQLIHLFKYYFRLSYSPAP